MDEYMGAIQAFGFNFAPRNWAFCNGQLMSISSNAALFSLLGTTFGGDGRTTFALPDLRGRSIVHPGTGPGLTAVQLGQRGGVERVYLTTANLPAHSHALLPGNVNVVTETTINTGVGSGINEPDNGSFPFASGGVTPNIYSEEAAGTDYVGGVTSQSAITGMTESTGASEDIYTRSPFLGIYTSICILGNYPPRS